MVDQTTGGAAAAPAAPAAAQNGLKHDIVTAVINGASSILQSRYSVPQDEAELLFEGIRALINSLFAHKAK